MFLLAFTCEFLWITIFTSTEFFTNGNSFMFSYFCWSYEFSLQIFTSKVFFTNVNHYYASLLVLIGCTFLLQNLQTKGFSPVWVLLCLSISHKCLNFFSQHSQLKNFSQIWILLCFCIFIDCMKFIVTTCTSKVFFTNVNHYYTS